MRRRYVLRNALMTALGAILYSCTQSNRSSSVSSATPQSPASPASTDSDLLNRLHQGGYVIYFRHGEAVTGNRPNGVEELPVAFQACLEPERPLTEQAVVDMQRVGETFRRLQIPVERVLSSPACRCIETALYAFNTVEVDRNLAGLIDLVPEGKLQRIAALEQMLSTPPPPGTNTILSAHISNIQAVIEGISLAQGEAAIILPRGENRFELIDQVTPSEWSSLAT
jgi:phosphohistidine phosphatase SixA